MQNSRFKKTIVIAVIVLFIVASIIPSLGSVSIKKKCSIENETPVGSVDSRGNTFYVGGSGPGNYTKIQDAIDNASDGDTVFVYDDSSPYYENIVINTSISLMGEDKNSTIIDGRGRSKVIIIKNNTDYNQISEFTIINASVGIRCLSNYNKIFNNKISDTVSGILLENFLVRKISLKHVITMYIGILSMIIFGRVLN